MYPLGAVAVVSLEVDAVVSLDVVADVSFDVATVVPLGVLNICDISTVVSGDDISADVVSADVSMLSVAGAGIAGANASPDAKAAAKYITVSNEEHAIARIIADIENGKISL